MAKRGPKSLAELTNPMAEGSLVVQSRADAPYDLADEVAEVWHATLAALPADWIGPEAHPVLAAYARATVQLRRIGQLIHQAETEKGELDLAAYLGLIKAHGQVAQVLKTLATSLRLTPQARMRAEGAGRKHNDFAGGKRPWET